MNQPQPTGDLGGLVERKHAHGNGSSHARPYDFRRPGKFSKDQLRTLTMLHDIFARLMTGFLAAHLRSRVQMSVTGVQQQTYQEFIQALPNPTVVGTFRMPPLPGVCLVHVTGRLAMIIVDRVFGGPGGVDQPERALTDIEQAVMRKVFQYAMDALRDAWDRVAKVRPQLEGVEVNPLFVQVAIPGEAMAVIELSVGIAGQDEPFSLAIPFTTLEPILAKLSPQSWFASVRDVAPEHSAQLRRSIGGAPVELVVQLGRARISVRDFLALVPGSVLLLDQRVKDDVAVYVDNQLAFYGRPGEVGGRMVVSIRQRCGGG